MPTPTDLDVAGAGFEPAIGQSPADLPPRHESPTHTDGTSVYRVAGSEVFTSGRILAAEERIVAAAGLTGGPVVAPETVNLALLESAANGIELNSGQAALVRELATSGARVQLAIAAAGTGKTTAMRVLTSAWEESGGTVIGLAPSAAAATALCEQTGTTTDTLAKLIHSLNNGQSIDWMDSIGPKTLVLIDEAAMADTLTLDTAISFLNSRGASVRLIGDDQQLAAIGAGGARLLPRQPTRPRRRPDHTGR